MTFEEIDAELDRIQAELDELEIYLITRRAMRDRSLRCTAQIQKAVHDIVAKYYQRWREKNGWEANGRARRMSSL